ncbi:MAG: UDP-glucuronic acid decarboxylase family protein [Bdellovibrionota bacterium]
MNKRSIVTGGAGFLGSHLCEKLLAMNHEVICLDNFMTSGEENIAHLVSHPKFKFINHDVMIPFHEKADWIFNLASPASPVNYQNQPILTTKTNILGAINMLDLAVATGARIFQASTSEVYGSPSIHPQKESYWGNVNPIGPRSCYDEGKRCAESLFFDYLREHKVDIRVGRIFNTFGPRMQPDDGRVVSNFIVQALAGKDLTIYGSGNQTRSFCYVTDMVEAIVAYMSVDSPMPGPVNLGNPGELNISALAALIIKLTGSSSQLVFKDLPQDDPIQRQPDISLAIKSFNWKPVVQMETGLKKTIEYFKNF